MRKLTLQDHQRADSLIKEAHSKLLEAWCILTKDYNGGRSANGFYLFESITKPGGTIARIQFSLNEFVRSNYNDYYQQQPTLYVCPLIFTFKTLDERLKERKLERTKASLKNRKQSYLTR